jgi:hypothetical protein
VRGSIPRRGPKGNLESKVTEPRAIVREIDGQLVLDDPDALAMIAAVGKANCAETFKAQRERVDHFTGRAVARGLGPKDVVIVLLNVNDARGGQLADLLMPNAGPMWDEMRARGEVPFARGLASRDGTADFVRAYDPECAAKLERLGVAVVVMDHGVIEVFES